MPSPLIGIVEDVAEAMYNARWSGHYEDGKRKTWKNCTDPDVRENYRVMAAEAVDLVTDRMGR